MADPPALPGVEHRFHALSTGVRAHVAHAGPEDAPPLVLLHGFPQHWYCWRKVIPLLSADFRILAMDTRGLGWSGPAGDYRKARIAEDAVALLDDLGIERAGLAGHDWGGWAGFLAVLRAPERWTGYVAAGVAHPWQPPERMLRALPRLAYQPPLAMPLLGPRLDPAARPGVPPGGLGRPLDLRRCRRRGVRRHLPRAGAGAGRQPLLPRLPHPRDLDPAHPGHRRVQRGSA